METLFKILLFGMLFFNGSIAQNLVSNYSFEQYTQCPDNGNRVPYAVGWENFLSTPDYYNSCALNLDQSVPQNVVGYQFAVTGNAYCGFFSYWDPYPWATPFNGREHIARQLNSPLTIGKRYFASINVSLAFNNGTASCATDKIGIKFSTISYENYAGDSCVSPLVNNFAHVYTDLVITDTINWTNISGYFIADSAYQYIIIGNFFDYDNVNTLLMGANPTCRAYYYLDDIEVVEDTILNTKIANVLERDIKVYSASGKIFISSIASGVVEIQIYNTLGQLMQQTNIFPFSDSIIDISDKEKGTYFIQIRSNQMAITKKVFLSN
jgi:hypothetical protein